MKTIPDILVDHILPFQWDVQKVWQQEAEVSPEPLADLSYLLDLPLWSSLPNRGMLFDISPREVIACPHTSPHQHRRILKADSNYPIDLMRYQERLWILDGVHRLAKLFLMETDLVKVRFHSEEIIPPILSHSASPVT